MPVAVAADPSDCRRMPVAAAAPDRQRMPIAAECRRTPVAAAAGLSDHRVPAAVVVVVAAVAAVAPKDVLHEAILIFAPQPASSLAPLLPYCFVFHSNHKVSSSFFFFRPSSKFVLALVASSNSQRLFLSRLFQAF